MIKNRMRMNFLQQVFMLFVLCFLCLFILPKSTAAHVQDSVDPTGNPLISFEQLTTDHGLAFDWIRGGVVQDPHGFLWVATNKGLSRYDGYQFKNYYHQPDNPNSLSSDSIRAVAIDAGGIIWLATAGGMDKFDPTTESATRYQHDPTNTAGLSDNDLREILVGSDGIIWIGSAGGGLNRFDPSTETFSHYQPDPIRSDSLGDSRVSALFEDGMGRLWVGTHRGGLQRLDSTGESFTTFRHDPADPNSLHNDQVTTIFEDSAGIFWVGTSTGLNRFDPNTETFTLVKPDADSTSPLSNDNIQTIVPVQAEPGLLWIGTSKGGLFKFNPATNQATSYQNDPQIPSSLSDNNVIAIFTDDSGVVWVATRNGLNKFAPFTKQFSYYIQQPGQTNTLSDDLVQAIYQTNDGLIWLGTNAGGLNRYDPETGRYTHYLHNPDDANSPLSNDIEGIAPGEPGILWLGYETNGLSKFDTVSETFTHFVPDSNDPASLPVGTVQNSLLYDPASGNLWLGLDGGGLVQLDPLTEDITVYRSDPDNPHSLSSNRIKHLFQDQNGAIWAGTVEPELNRLDPNTGEVTRFYYDTDEVDARVAILYEAADGLMWVSAGSDLLKFNPASGQFFADEETAPWAGQSIVALSVDGRGNFWLGGQTGLDRYDPLTGSITHFDERDGFISCCGGWSLNPDTGQFFTSGSRERGFHSFNINQIQPRTYQPPVVLTDFYLFGQPVSIGGDSPLQETIFATNSLTLANSDNFAFEFTALDYTNPDSIEYRYQLEGFEENWNDVGPQRRYAAYTSLPAGDYTFRVQATNSQDRWGEREVALPITIVPPWWQTRWFQAILLGVIVTLVYGGYRWRLWQADRRSQLLEQQIAERTLALADSEARFRGLSSSTFEAVIIHEQGKILDVNQITVAMFGYSREELIGMHTTNLTAPDSRQFVDQQVRAGSEEVYEIDGLTKDGRKIPLEVRAKMIPYQDRQVRVVAVRDLTERRQIESHKQRLAVMEERERIGRELHDDLGQVMGYVSLQTQTAQELVKDGQADKALSTLQKLAQVANEAHANVRQYILGVRTEQPVRINFLEELQFYIQQLDERYGLTVHLTWAVETPDSPLTADVERQLLRIIQEALMNVRNHSKVDTARILFTLQSDVLQVVIADEGHGFDLESAIKDPSHFGLQIMRERAEAVGGTLQIISAPDQGTQVIARLPCLLKPLSDRPLSGLRVMIVDDHPLYREGLHNLLSSRGIQVIGQAADGVEAQQLAHQQLPDLILMDVEMPRCDGLEATRRIKAEFPEIKIIILTVAADDEVLFEALKSGAAGYLLKSLDSRQFFDLLNQVMEGETVLSPSLATRLLTEFSGEKAETDQDQLPLTDRQLEVLELLAQDLTNREIAQKLVISENTVKYHVRQILERLQMADRHKLARYARQKGLVSPDEPQLGA